MLLSGPGLLRIADAMGAGAATPEALVAARATDARAARAWGAWCDLLAELIVTLALVVDPAAVVLGGGLSRVPGVLEDVAPRVARTGLPGFSVPRILLAEGGDASGARGAAFAATQEARHD